MEECVFIQVTVLVQLDGKEYDVMNVSTLTTTLQYLYVILNASCIQLFAHHLVVHMDSVCPQRFATVTVVGKGQLVHKVSHNPSYQALVSPCAYICNFT